VDDFTVDRSSPHQMMRVISRCKLPERFIQIAEGVFIQIAKGVSNTAAIVFAGFVEWLCWSG
jgi:hypothetical protein